MSNDNTQDQLLQDASTLLMFANVAAKQHRNSPSPVGFEKDANIRPKMSTTESHSQTNVLEALPIPPQPQHIPSQPPQIPLKKAKTPPNLTHPPHTVFDPVRQIYVQKTPPNPSPQTSSASPNGALIPHPQIQVLEEALAPQTKIDSEALPNSTQPHLLASPVTNFPPPSSSAPVSNKGSTHSSISEPRKEPAKRRSNSIHATSGFNHALSPGPASVALARGNSGNHNNAIIAAAALAQAADNPIPLLKREENGISSELKSEEIEKPAPLKQETEPEKQETKEGSEKTESSDKPEPETKREFKVPPLLEYKVEPDSGIIGCICGLEDDDGFTIQCDICYRWQHCVCMDYSTNEEVPEDEYRCYFCDKEKWGKFDPEKCKQQTINRLKQEDNDDDDDENQLAKPSNKRKVSTSRLEDKKKRRVEANGLKERRKQLSDDFNNPTQEEPQVVLPNKENELLDDGVSAENYQSTYYKLKSNDYANPGSQKQFEAFGRLFYERYQQLDADKQKKLNVTISTTEEFDSIPRMFVHLPSKEKYLTEHDQTYDLPNIHVQVRQYSDSQKQKFNGISKLSLFIQANENDREEFEEVIPEGTPILEYFGVLDIFTNYRDNKTNQYNIWGTTKPKVLKTSLDTLDQNNDITSLDLVLDSRFVGNESRFIRKACPTAVNCTLKAYYVPEISSFRFLVVTSKEIKLTHESPSEELRLPWEWDESHPIRKMYGDDALKFDQLQEKDKSLLINTIDNLLYFSECGCSTTSSTPLYLPSCAVFKVRKAITYLLRSTRKISGITNVNLYKPRDELFGTKEPKKYVSWEERLSERDEYIEAKLFLPSLKEAVPTDEKEPVNSENIQDVVVKSQISKLDTYKNDNEHIEDEGNDDILGLVPVSDHTTAGIEKSVEQEVKVKPEIQRSISEIKLKLTDNNLSKINKVLNIETPKPEPKPVEVNEKPVVKKKLSFADYKKKMK